jgi:hypothetical protein
MRCGESYQCDPGTGTCKAYGETTRPIHTPGVEPLPLPNLTLEMDALDAFRRLAR